MEQIQKGKNIKIHWFSEKCYETKDIGGHLKTFYSATILYEEIDNE